jgi:hypothetical protein
MWYFDRPECGMCGGEEPLVEQNLFEHTIRVGRVPLRDL